MARAAADPILRPRQARYLERLRPPRDPLRREMEAAAAAEGIPIASPDLARLLEALAAIRPDGRVLEVGTAIGYGTLHLARGAHAGTVVSIDSDAERLERARGYLERAGVAGRVELVHGRALEVLARLEPMFDLVFLDAEKTEYRRQLDLVVPKLPVGGRVVVDNLLWHGRIADPQLRPEGDRDAAAIEAFNPYLMIHPQLATVLLPLGDGVGLAVKRRVTMRELGGPY
ncbi:MAG: putative O-methyltransferase mdmC [Acidobacteria bacterium]|nr:putative O-methyltransferase mdmC [Acidobacteriota bacterium]